METNFYCSAHVRDMEPIICMSWNLLAQRYTLMRWEQRRDLIEATIDEILPDIILLQEVTLETHENDLSFMAEHYDFVVHQRCKKRTNFMGNMILWRRDAFTLLSSSQYYAEISCCLQSLKTRRQINVTNLHLKGGLHSGLKERRSQLSQLLARLDYTCEHHIIGGDFNDDLLPGGQLTRMLYKFQGVNEKLQSCWVNDRMWSFDYILTHGLQRLSFTCREINDQIPNQEHPSDHLPVVLRFQ
jgi:endonuclease/exonuclease/phosphatase family metal-dependent hydrolase